MFLNVGIRKFVKWFKPYVARRDLEKSRRVTTESEKWFSSCVFSFLLDSYFCDVSMRLLHDIVLYVVLDWTRDGMQG